MAYSTLLSLEKAINQILDHDRVSISPHEKKHLISLDRYVIFFQAFLEEFPEKGKNLEARIRDAAVEAEDIIEWFCWKQIQNNYRYIKRISILLRIKLKHRLQKVRDEMDSIAAMVVEIQNSIKIEGVQLGESAGAGSSSQVADAGKINMVGFNEDLIEIKEKLCGRAQQLQVLPIFGMGGIGKTTLAKNAYNDQLIVEHFQIRSWVNVTQDYSQRKILMDLLDSIKKLDPNWMMTSMAGNNEQINSKMVESFEQDHESPEEISKQSNSNESLAKIPQRKNIESNIDMAVKVHKILKGRRFLIVIDDVWSTKVVDDVMNLSPDDNNGSRIMSTTRLKEVATYANSSTLFHEMRLMDADQSWNLLREKVFIHQDSIPRELESTGREIARSCGGLPLAIVVITGLLSTASKTLNSWKEVASNIRSSLATTDGQIEKILSLSYNHLPHHLRQCFLYMGGFPEDHEIKATHLIRLWVAESFVKPIVSKRLEDIAEEYLEDLVDRSLVVVAKRRPNGKIKCCSLHDMVREMCIKLSREEKFFVHIKGTGALKLLKSMKDQRRISISSSDLRSFDNIYSSNIRSIIFFHIRVSLSFKGFRFLRVLDVLRVRDAFSFLPFRFSELFHLRYLAFCNFRLIPGTIANLQNLQTLIIKEYGYSSLPDEIWNMPQLRHLIFSKKCLPNTNASTSALENLQTLGKVKNLTCSVSTLNLIPNLTKLWLTYSYGSGELLFHNLVHLRRLEKLHLELRYGWRGGGKPNLVVPSSLKKLTLIGWGNEEPYLDIVGPFPNLEVLKLKSFNFMPRVWITTEEDFPQLRFLFIEKSDLRHWETESSHFPRLKSLLIHSCLGLSEIPECIGEIPTLELIELKICTESLADSAKRIQEEAQSYTDDVFEVRYTDCKAVREPFLPPPPAQPTLSSQHRVNQPTATTKPQQPHARRGASRMHPLSYMLRYGLIPREQ